MGQPLGKSPLAVAGEGPEGHRSCLRLAKPFMVATIVLIFIDEETEAQRHRQPCFRSHSWSVQGWTPFMAFHGGDVAPQDPPHPKSPPFLWSERPFTGTHLLTTGEGNPECAGSLGVVPAPPSCLGLQGGGWMLPGTRPGVGGESARRDAAYGEGHERGGRVPEGSWTLHSRRGVPRSEDLQAKHCEKLRLSPVGLGPPPVSPFSWWSWS